MKTKTHTYTFVWKTFEPGDLVSPISSRSALKPGVYEVIEFVDPSIPFELSGTVFVEDYKFGVSAEYLELAEEE